MSTGIDFFTFYATTGAEKYNHQLVVATTGAFTLTSVNMYYNTFTWIELHIPVQYISNIYANFLYRILQSGIFTAIFQHLLSFLKKWSQCL